MRWLVALAMTVVLVIIVVVCTWMTDKMGREPVSPISSLRPVHADTNAPEVVAPASHADRTTNGDLRLVARAVDTSGRPIAGMMMCASFQSRLPAQRPRSVTAADGSFELPLSEFTKLIHPIHVVLTEIHAVDEVVPALDAREAVVLLPLPLRGPWKAGDLTFVVPPLLVDGHVVDDSGQGVSSARVYASYENPAPNNGKQKDFSVFQATTNEPGEFRLRGRVDATVLQVYAIKKEARSEATDVTPGTSGARLALIATYHGRLECSFKLDTGTPPGTMLAAVQFFGQDTTTPPPGTSRETVNLEELPGGFVFQSVVEKNSSRQRPINGGEMVRFDPLPPGLASLSVVIRDGQFPVLQLDDLVIPDHGRCTDPRLESIDLRGKIVWTRALLLNPFGEPFANSVFRIEDDVGHGTDVRTDNEGWFSLPVPASSKKFAVVAKGYRRAMFEKDDTIKLIVE